MVSVLAQGECLKASQDFEQHRVGVLHRVSELKLRASELASSRASPAPAGFWVEIRKVFQA
jgi:hypothetical protein